MTFRMPPEWAPQDWLWIGFPHDAEEWPDSLGRAQEQIAAFASAVAGSGQQVRLLVRDEANEACARALVSAAVTLERRVYGDVWLRDTGPLVVLGEGGRRVARRPRFQRLGRQVRDGRRPGHRRRNRARCRAAGRSLRLGSGRRGDRWRWHRAGRDHRAMPAQPEPQPAFIVR